MSESPWSKEAPPSAMLPPPAGVPPAEPRAVSVPVEPVGPRRSTLAGGLVRLLVAAGVAAAVGAAVGSTVSYLAVRSDHAASPPASPQTVSPSPPPVTPQFSLGETAAAKHNLCHVFDVSVRGQEGQGGLRLQGTVNVPVVLRALNSASAVQNALENPAVPGDVASAARKYVSATLDETTAAMGNTPTSESNRLTDARTDAIYALLDACGLPR
jgi:hypothetical protein